MIMIHIMTLVLTNRKCTTISYTTMIDWDDFDMYEDDEDYIESQKRKQQEEDLRRKKYNNS